MVDICYIIDYYGLPLYPTKRQAFLITHVSCHKYRPFAVRKSERMSIRKKCMNTRGMSREQQVPTWRRVLSLYFWWSRQYPKAVMNLRPVNLALTLRRSWFGSFFKKGRDGGTEGGSGSLFGDQEFVVVKALSKGYCTGMYSWYFKITSDTQKKKRVI